MFKHILVPLDLGRNERSLRTARTLARQNGARVTLLHVIQRIEDIPAAELRRFYCRHPEEQDLETQLGWTALVATDGGTVPLGAH